MGRQRTERQPCDIEAIYHAKELTRYTMNATKSKLLFPGETIIPIIKNVQQDTLSVYQILSVAAKTQDVPKRLDMLDTAYSTMICIQATAELLCDIDGSNIKNLKFWAERMDNVMISINRWRESIKKNKNTIPSDQK